MRPPKFNFVPEHQLVSKNVDTFFYGSISKNGQLFFGKDYSNVYELNQKFYECYVDREKQSIGWRIIEGKTDLESLHKQFVADPTKGTIRISIVSLLKALGLEKGTVFPRLPIGMYKTKATEGEIHYIILPSKEADITLNGIRQ